MAGGAREVAPGLSWNGGAVGVGGALRETVGLSCAKAHDKDPKTQHSVKDLSCVEHTAKLGRHTWCLLCVLFRAHDKAIAVCFIGPMAK